MAKFASPEWAALYPDAVNSNEAYAKAADWWTGDFIFQVDPHGGLEKQILMWVGLHKGKCTGCAILKEKISEFKSVGGNSQIPVGKIFCGAIGEIEIDSLFRFVIIVIG